MAIKLCKHLEFVRNPIPKLAIEVKKQMNICLQPRKEKRKKRKQIAAHIVLFDHASASTLDTLTKPLVLIIHSSTIRYNKKDQK